MKFVATFEFVTRNGTRRTIHEARITYTVMKGRAQAYGQPAEPVSLGSDMDFEINLSGSWFKASADMHDFLLSVLGDDLEWLIDEARDQALAAVADAADHKRQAMLEAAE